ncbi:bifunctional dihydrofolate reductase-thymidylate synthase [Drosophila suzukii associated hytrosavirus 1]|nr:bifunctional dihydrofolate reductase-thymidylate synthase [Drosophila suzukii associated hytrosavirus 1]
MLAFLGGYSTTMDRMNEAGYLSLIRHVLFTGRDIDNGNGIETRSIFGEQLRYNLRCNRLAMLTTKFISFSSVAHELFWFLRGDTNQQTLADKQVYIWKANSTREFLDSRRLFHYREYESLGPIYGFQWRHFGAKYTDCHADYRGKGLDQLQMCLDQIKNNPNSRRIIMSAWNPCALDEMVLPPCHLSVQFEVNVERKELSAHLYQRNADLILGVPYNLLSYSLLVHIMARKCGLTAGDLICSYGNLHIYRSHLMGARNQVARKPYNQPRIEMNFDPELPVEELNLKHFCVKEYRHQGKIFFENTL